ncbi:MAG: YjfB family protein [Methylocystis sp.]|uniref:YjfB family protein n=1 Tax=Methylocystis sp. TaxID=1911079 RepID=UPI003DA26365
MDVNNIASLVTAMANQRTADAIGIAMLKKTLDIQASSTLTLIDTLQQPAAANPPHLGDTIDTSA